MASVPEEEWVEVEVRWRGRCKMGRFPASTLRLISLASTREQGLGMWLMNALQDIDDADARGEGGTFFKEPIRIK